MTSPVLRQKRLRMAIQVPDQLVAWPVRTGTSCRVDMKDNKAHFKILRLCVSSGHNFFGHHQKPAGEHPIVEVEEIECVAGRGIRGDRFFDFEENYRGQITFFSQEVFDAMCAELRLAGKAPTLSRRNVIVAGADLNSLVGREFDVQGVHFRGTAECAPCYWMDTAFGPGAERFLKNRGGLRAQVLTSGILRVTT